MFKVSLCSPTKRVGNTVGMEDAGLFFAWLLNHMHFRCLFSTVLCCHFKNSHRKIKIDGGTIFSTWLLDGVFDHVLLCSLIPPLTSLGSRASACGSSLGWYLGTKGKSTVPVHCKHRGARVPE